MKLFDNRHNAAIVAPSSKTEDSSSSSIQSFFHLDQHPHLKDSVQVQTSDAHNYVNDCEKHEEIPHLQDFLKPHHTLHVVVDGTESTLPVHEHNEGSSSFFENIPCPHEIVHVVPAGGDHTKAEDVAATTTTTATTTNAQTTPTKSPSLPPRPPKSSLRTLDGETRKAYPNTEGRRTLQFQNVILREYGMILGDHPCCRFGLPVTIEWDYLEYQPLSVDDYEVHHALRRPLRQMHLSSSQREAILQDLHYPQSDIRKARKELIRIQNGRLWTKTIVESPFLSQMDNGVRSLARKVKRRVKVL